MRRLEQVEQKGRALWRPSVSHDARGLRLSLRSFNMRDHWHVAAHPRPLSKFRSLIVEFTSPTVKRDPPPIFQAMLRPAYTSKKLTQPVPTKDGGTLRTILEACEYMAAMSKERELRPHWQLVRDLIHQEADVAAVSWQVRLAVLKDAKLDVSALSEPLT
jgi:hypothetical protein